MENDGSGAESAPAGLRERELEARAREYLAVRGRIATGLELAEMTAAARDRILALTGGSVGDWSDWRWQLRNRLTDAALLAEVLRLTPEEVSAVRRVESAYRWAISPYYASLIDPADPACPLRRQAVPTALELAETGILDPSAEAATSPVPGVVRRYPDRLIINVTNQCAVFCRHCQRRRDAGQGDRHAPPDALAAALDYVRRHEAIRDVLLTGGDALLIPDSQLDWLLTGLDRIPHVEIKRIGTRCLATMPQRVTREIVDLVRAHPPLYVITQFNHPREVTAEAAAACAGLISAGAVLGNQTVLLRGVNDDANVIRRLNHELLKLRVRPYYLFHALPVKGTMHFRTRIEDGMAIMEKLRGWTSGLAIPTYAVNAPGGGGKVPLMPEYVLDVRPGAATVRTWEGAVITIPN